MLAEQLQLKEGERVVGSARISKAAIVILWVSVPCFLLVSFGALYIPPLLRVGKVVSLVDEEIGEGLSKAAIGVLTFIVILLAAVWAGVAAVLTKRNVCFSLIYTNLRVFATTKNEQLEAPVGEIKNVFVGDSLLGKLFGYGNLTVQTERGSITVKNVCEPEELKRALFKLLEDPDETS